MIITGYVTYWGVSNNFDNELCVIQLPHNYIVRKTPAHPPTLSKNCVQHRLTFIPLQSIELRLIQVTPILLL